MSSLRILQLCLGGVTLSLISLVVSSRPETDKKISPIAFVAIVLSSLKGSELNCIVGFLAFYLPVHSDAH